jgi:Fe-S oxidoreductase
VGAYREEDATAETLDFLDGLGVDYTLVDEACCSGVLGDVGFEINPALARRNIRTFLDTGAKKVITGCPYCFRTFTEKPEYAPLREAGVQVLHLSQFLQDMDFGVSTDKVVTYHDPCDLGRHCGIYDAPRQTIRRIAPNFVELPHNRADAMCCGAGGGVRAAYSIAMARNRLKEVEEVGAEILLTECNSCLHNLSNAKLRKQRFRIYTTTQFIQALLEGDE